MGPGPDGSEVSSSDPAVHDRLSELVGKPARLESLPALSEKRRYRAAAGHEGRYAAAIPDMRCSIPTRQQGGLPADPDVLRTIDAHADHCLGVYATVATAGVLAEGDALEPPGPASAAAAAARAGATKFKRRALQVFDALMPRGE